MQTGGVTPTVRLLAGVTGGLALVAVGFVFLSFAAVASGFSLDWSSASWWGAATVGPALLILGSSLGGRRQSMGLALMCVGAVLLSPSAFFYGVSALIAPIQSPNPIVLMVAGFAVLLVATCDFLLLKSVIRSVRRRSVRSL